MIIKALIEKYGFSLEKLLLLESDNLGITSNEAYVLYALLISSTNNIFSEIKLKEKLNDNFDGDIHETLSSLMTKKLFYLELERRGDRQVEVINPSQIYKKIENIVLLESQKELNNNNDISKIVILLEEKIKRPLTIREIDIVKGWFVDNINIELIKASIEKQRKDYFSVLGVEKELVKRINKVHEVDDNTSKKLDEIFKKI